MLRMHVRTPSSKPGNEYVNNQKRIKLRKHRNWYEMPDCTAVITYHIHLFLDIWVPTPHARPRHSRQFERVRCVDAQFWNQAKPKLQKNTLVFDDY